MTITPNCTSPRSDRTLQFVSKGFRSGEEVKLTATTPEGLSLPVGGGTADAQGTLTITVLVDRPSNWPRGLYTVVAEGATSGKKATGYFKIIGASSN
jgi:hypothetical protein